MSVSFGESLLPLAVPLAAEEQEMQGLRNFCDETSPCEDLGSSNDRLLARYARIAVVWDDRTEIAWLSRLKALP